MPHRLPAALPPQAVERLDAWLKGYRPEPGRADELVDGEGAHRRLMRALLVRLAAEDEAARAERCALADRSLEDTGVAYRVLGEPRDRAWPLSHLPLALEEAEWLGIAEGVAERADLLDAVLADLYGPGRLVADGLMPAGVVAGARDYLRPLVGVAAPGGHHLHLYAADLVRAADGRWTVIGDRTQAPSGAGYALQNRIATARGFTSLYQDMNVERLAPFFQAFRMGLASAAQRAEPRLALLTPGAHSESYIEQATLAHYLGLLLVQGEDLTVREGRVFVRTIAGLKRADVLWRRVDSDYCDPLELHTGSKLGVAGLVEALRAGGVVVANMPGTGVVETRAAFACLPRLGARLLGRALRLASLETHWCGEGGVPPWGEGDAQLLPAFQDDLPAARPPRPGPEGERERLRLRPMDHVLQRPVLPSTMPVFAGGGIAPRPFVLRVFAARTPEGWRVMPGGFCRVADRREATAVAMGAGARSADVWIAAQRPVTPVTLLPSIDTLQIRRIPGNLSSRAADNLFWFGRYLERTETTIRLVRALAAGLVESDVQEIGRGDTNERLARMLIAWGAVPVGTATADVPRRVLEEGASYGALPSLIEATRKAAAAVRDRLSNDVLGLLVDLDVQARPRRGLATDTLVQEQTNRLLAVLGAISGFAHENMIRVMGWAFLDMGRRVERAVATCRFARWFGDDDASADDLDVLLELCDSQIGYRSRYVAGLAVAPVRDLVMLDPFNPRSVAFQIDALHTHITKAPSLREDGVPEAPWRLITRLAADVATLDAQALDGRGILTLEQHCLAVADEIAARFFQHGPRAAREIKLTELA